MIVPSDIIVPADKFPEKYPPVEFIAKFGVTKSPFAKFKNEPASEKGKLLPDAKFPDFIALVANLSVVIAFATIVLAVTAFAAIFPATIAPAAILSATIAFAAILSATTAFAEILPEVTAFIAIFASVIASLSI